MKHETSGLGIGVALLAGAARLLGAETISESAHPRIGLLLPPEEAEAASLRQGVLLGVDDANKGAPVRASIVIRGRTGQWGADAVEAAGMATDDGVGGLIGPPDGSASHLTLQVAGRTAVPVISLCPDSSVTQTGVRWMVRMVPRTVDEAQAVFQGLDATVGPGVAKWCAVVPNGRPGRETTRDLKQAAAVSRCSIERVLEAALPFSNAEALSKKVLAIPARAILVWLDPVPAGRLVRALRSGGFAGTLAGPGRLRSADFVAAAGDGLDGFIIPSPRLDPATHGPSLHFEAAYRARFGREPDATAAAGYDAARLLIRLLQQAGDQPPHTVFPISMSFTGATGVLAFDSEGNRKVDLQLLEARHGRFGPLASGSTGAAR